MLKKMIKNAENYDTEETTRISKGLFDYLTKNSEVFLNKDRLAVLKGLTFKDLTEFSQKWLMKMRYEWFVMGNCSPDNAKKLVQNCEELIKNMKQKSSILSKHEVANQRFYKYPKNKTYVYEM